MMTTLSPRAQAVLEQFGQQPGVTPDQISNLQRVIRNSPPLAVQIEAAISEGIAPTRIKCRGNLRRLDENHQPTRLNPLHTSLQRKTRFG